MLASESVLAFLDSPTSPLPPPSPSPPRLPRALLVAYSVDQDLKRAALDILKRLASKDRAARKRARLSSGSSSNEGEEEEVAANGRRRVDLHVLLLPVESTSSMEMNDDVLELLEEMGVHVHIHPLFFSTGNRLSFTSLARSSMQQALGADGPYQSLLEDELAAAGFVFGSHPCEGNEACQVFVEILAKHASTAFPSHKSSPTVTLYVPSRPATSDFDLDLPAEEVLSLRLVNSTAKTFTSACPSFPPPPQSSRRSRLSWGGPNILSPSPSPTPTSGGGKKHRSRPSLSPSSSYLGPPPPSSSSPTPTSFKPLVLRPAPGPVQSVALRLTIDTSDVLFRVQETLTPVDPATGGRFGPASLLLPSSSSPSAPSPGRAPNPLPRSPAPPLRLVEPSSPPESPSSSSPSALRRLRSIKRVEHAPPPAFDGSQHEALTKKPLARSDTVLKPADLKRNPQLGEVQNLLKGRVGRREATKTTAVVAA